MTVEAAREDKESIAFSHFRLDLRAGQLSRAGAAIPLRPKTWAVLLYLAERPGVLVSRDDLLDAVWQDVSVTPDTLTKSIGELRAALGDDPRTPSFVETVHRRGFRFIGQPSQRTPEIVGLAARDDASAPFVGRAAELQNLLELLARAQAGERQILFITGEAGVGKTRLIEAFLASNPVARSASPLWVGRGGSVEQYGTREPYMPVLEALGRLAQRPDADGLLKLLRGVAPTWLAQLPWLIGADAEDLQRALHAARAERMLREFAILIEELTTQVTVVLVLEDLHWSDPSTVDLLSLLAQRREPARLLVIGTYRPAETAVHDHRLAHAVRALRLHRHCRELPLYELIEDDVAAYLHLKFPGAEIPVTLARVIRTHTDGNPLFVSAVVQQLIARGWILDTAPGWSFTTVPERMDLGLPDDALRMIDTQFEDLSPADQRLLEGASVAGTAVSAHVLAAALGCAEDDAEDRCEALGRSQRFLHVAAGADPLDDSFAARYEFTHELYRKGVYAHISERQRRRLHRRIGEVLEKQYGERAAEIAPDLAVHFEQAGDATRAARYLSAAATRASQRFASREAAGYLEAALDMTARLPDDDERRRSELDLRIAIWPLLNDLHGYASDQLLENSERAYELCAEVGTPQQLFHILYALCYVHGMRADPVLAPETAAQMSDLAQRLGSPEYRFLADSALARLALTQARYDEACRLAEDLALRRRTAPVRLDSVAVDGLIGTATHHALALWFLGQCARAQTTMRAAVADAHANGTTYVQAIALGHTGLLALLCRHPADVRGAADQLALLAEREGFSFYIAMALLLRGWAQVQVGDIGGGIEQLERAQVALRATGSRVLSTCVFAFIAEGHLRSGNSAAGLAVVAKGLETAEETLDRTWWPELWRLKGELLLAAAGGREPRTGTTTHWSEAEQCLERALELARHMKARSLELRAATALARVWRDRNRQAKAGRLLHELCEWFGEDPDNPDLVEAGALLEELSPVPPARPGERGTRRAVRKPSSATPASVRLRG